MLVPWCLYLCGNDFAAKPITVVVRVSRVESNIDALPQKLPNVFYRAVFPSVIPSGTECVSNRSTKVGVIGRRPKGVQDFRRIQIVNVKIIRLQNSQMGVFSIFDGQ